MFPSSFEANGGLTDGGESVTHSIFEFPSPLEETEVSNKLPTGFRQDTRPFPSPTEVNGGLSYAKNVADKAIARSVSVPSRGDWGF